MKKIAVETEDTLDRRISKQALFPLQEVILWRKHMRTLLRSPLQGLNLLFSFSENMPIVKSLTLPSASLPMKLVSLEEAQARSLSASHPARKERRENSLPEIVPVTGSLFHTVVDLPDSKYVPRES